ncbi:ferredoxin [Achromobacter piechaudii]|uniref:four-helix bundle copper-binding protein n=1 Tax=Achromobacter piechaudii TaxID=72556 RepID=UPI000681BA58|nr:four-helix bundle copper-binding protein [Achromobacter piechaudii]KNY06623.1 ferredoxin [Achromobacter piechaudii]
MTAVNNEMEACIDTCLACYRRCLQTAANHCLEAGGEHVEPEHFRLMMACAEICRTSAHTMLIGIEQHASVCGACAQICAACADSCDAIGGMQDCAAACRRCAESCQKMAG